MKTLHNNKGMTLTEILMASLLLSVIFLAVSSLYVASQKMFISRDDKVVISYELQYVSQHIYKNVMKAIGHTGRGGRERRREFLPIRVLRRGRRLSMRINNNSPITRDNYEDVDIYTYSRSNNDELIFNDGQRDESLVSRVDVTDANFSLDENLLTISLTGSYREETLTIHTACYPRIASYR